MYAGIMWVFKFPLPEIKLRTSVWIIKALEIWAELKFAGPQLELGTKDFLYMFRNACPCLNLA